MKLSPKAFVAAYLLVPMAVLAGARLLDVRRDARPSLDAPAGESAVLVVDQDYGPVAARIMAGARSSIHLGILRIGGDSWPPPAFDGDRWPQREPVNQLIWELVDAARRGVAVSVKLNQPGFTPLDQKSNLFVADLLRREGVQVVFSSRAETLHSKFLVVDNAFSLVGAGNWCLGSLARNNDLGVLVHSPRIAGALVAYWERIPVQAPEDNLVPLPAAVEGALGEKKKTWTELPPMRRWHWRRYASCRVAEDRNYLPQLLALIDGAVSSIYIGQSEINFAAEGDGMHRILQALRNAAARDVEVRVLMQDEMIGGWSKMTNTQTMELLHGWRIHAVLDPPGKTMHSKFLVVDRAHSVIGSTNWCPAAVDRGHELSLIIDSEELAADTIAYWWSIVNAAPRAK